MNNHRLLTYVSRSFTCDTMKMIFLSKLKHK
uniref:Uncharacterized protein n=1 Tax=Rhizophora mucronata TaxID=61149 RepID=A0A2P2M247_RHIMU